MDAVAARVPIVKSSVDEKAQHPAGQPERERNRGRNARHVDAAQDRHDRCDGITHGNQPLGPAALLPIGLGVFGQTHLGVDDFIQRRIELETHVAVILKRRACATTRDWMRP